MKTNTETWMTAFAKADPAAVRAASDRAAKIRELREKNRK